MKRGEILITNSTDVLRDFLGNDETLVQHYADYDYAENILFATMCHLTSE